MLQLFEPMRKRNPGRDRTDAKTYWHPLNLLQELTYIRAHICIPAASTRRKLREWVHGAFHLALNTSKN